MLGIGVIVLVVLNIILDTLFFVFYVYRLWRSIKIDKYLLEANRMFLINTLLEENKNNQIVLLIYLTNIDLLCKYFIKHNKDYSMELLNIILNKINLTHPNQINNFKYIKLYLEGLKKEEDRVKKED